MHQQVWADWWRQLTSSTRDSGEGSAPSTENLRFRYRPDLNAALNRLDEDQPLDTVLHFAQRAAWEPEYQSSPSAASILSWIERLKSEDRVPSGSLQTANIAVNVSDVIEADGGPRSARLQALSDELDTPSTSLLKNTDEECSQAIVAYLARYHDLLLPWTQQYGLSPVVPAANDAALPGLEKETHFRFLSRLIEKLPGGFASLDASRPWMFYWVINSFKTMNLGFDRVDESVYRASYRHPYPC